MRKKYFISVDLDVAGINANSEEEALSKAQQLIKEGEYSLNICDIDEADEEEGIIKNADGDK